MTPGFAVQSLKFRLGRVLTPRHLICSIKCPGDSAFDIFGYFSFSKLVKMISGLSDFCYRSFGDGIAIRMISKAPNDIRITE